MNCVFLDLLGIPFKLHGRTKSGMDCYGLVLEVEKRLGHEMIDMQGEFKDNFKKDLNDNLYHIINYSKLKETKTPHYGDIVLFFDTKGRTEHIGVVLNNKDFIHCNCNGVHISNLNGYLGKWGFYTWQE